MRKASKWLVLLLVLAMTVSVFAVAGCTSKPSTSGNTSTSGESNEPSGTNEASEKQELKLVTPGTLTIGSDTAFPPFETMNGTTAEGFDVDLVAAIAQEMGVKSEFKSEKFDTLIPQLKAGGKFDMIASAMTITDERKKEVDFSDPYIDSNQSLAVKKDSKIANTKDAALKTVGVQSGTTGEAWAKENLKSAKIVPFDDTLAAFAALQAGKVDGIINDLPVSAFIVKDPARSAKIVEEIPTGEQYGFAISKDNPDLTKAVSEALGKLKSSGKYAEIYKKWFGVEPPK
jgi:polar amino acid transport system substrate-binding protein